MNVGIIASHRGSVLQAVIDAAEGPHPELHPCIVISNNSRSGAASRAVRHGIPFRHLSGRTHPDPRALDAAIAQALVEAETQLVFLAGYMKKLGPQTLQRFENRILNTHPSLLPKFGGQGMYGEHVHRAVLEARESRSGVSVHLVDAGYDTGPVVARGEVDVLPGDSVATLAERVQARERELVVNTLSRIALGQLVLPA